VKAFGISFLGMPRSNHAENVKESSPTMVAGMAFLAVLCLVFGIFPGLVGEVHLYIASIVTILSKGILIPMFLRKIVRRMKVTHDVEPYISNALSLTISGILVAVVYASLKEGIFVTGFSKNVLQISIAVILIGLFMMITRRKAITQVIGLLFMENGLFLAGFSLTFGMPTIIELGSCSTC
jgi:hydrogenase-4 component E